MVEMKAAYQGEKHCELGHGPSGAKIETDAPKDNLGRGEAFSPTDLVGAALASCALTTMAIFAEKNGIPVELKGAKARVVKGMVSDPRRIGSLPVEISMPKGIPTQFREQLENAAHGCPVARSLHADVQAPISFIYED